jgi:hypothetical protein
MTAGELAGADLSVHKQLFVRINSHLLKPTKPDEPEPKRVSREDAEKNKCVGAIHELPATFHHADTFGRFVNRPYGVI